MTQPFYINPTGDTELTYGQVLESLTEEVYAPILRPRSTGETILGVIKAMVHGVPLRLVDSNFSDPEIRSLGLVSGDCGKRTSLRGFTSAPTLDEAQSMARSPSDFSLELYTSGSTGLPKLVRHRLASLTRTLRIKPDYRHDVWALAYNPTHIAGIQVLLQAFFNGNPLVEVFGLSRNDAQSQLQRHRVTHISATPTFYRLLLPLEHPLPEVRSLTLGGERSDAALIARLQTALPQARVRNLYASTEAGTLLASDGELFGFHPAVDGKVRIIDGQLWVSREILGEFDGSMLNDWYATGDRVEIVSASPLRFRITGRDKDFVNVGGAKVDPSEVEQCIRLIPGISDVRVFSRANSVVGSILCAEYIAQQDIPERELRARLGARLQPHKIPRVIRRVPELPQTRSGKVSRHV